MAGAIQQVVEIVLRVLDKGGTSNIGRLSKEMEKLSKAGQDTQRTLSRMDAFAKLKKETKDSEAAWRSAQQEVQRLAKAMRESGTSTEAQRKQFAAARAEAQRLKAEFQQNQQKLHELRTALNSAGVNTKAFGAEQARLRQQLRQSQEELKRLQAAAAAKDLLGTRAFKDIQAEIKRVNAAYDTLRKSGKLTAEELRRAHDAAKGKVSELNKEMAGLTSTSESLSGAFGGLVSTLAGMMGIAFPVTKAAEFQRAMSEVAAISGATEDQFARLTAVALKMGAETEFTAVQAAEGLKYLSMAGLNAEQAMTALPSVLQLAQAGAMDLGRAADIATNIMTGFRLQAEELGRVNDVLVQTFTHSNSTLEDLGYAFAYVGPIASGLGADFEDLAAALGLLHNAGLKGSMAGTALRAALDSLFNPTKEEAKLIAELEKRLGGASLQLRNSEGNFIGFAAVVRQLQAANLSAAEALELFGLRAGPGMAALVGIGADALDDFVRLNEQAEGRAAKIAQVMKSNTVGAFRELTSAAEGLVIQIGNKLLPTVEALIRWLTGVTSATRDWMQDHPALTAGVVKLAAAVVVLMTGMTALKTITGAAALAKGLFLSKVLALAPGLAGATSAIASTATAVGGFFAVLAAGLAGWAAGQWINTLTVPFDAAGRSVGEFVQIGYAQIGGFLNWWSGADNTANQSVIDGINQAASARKYATEQARIGHEREIAMQRELASATAGVTKEIEAVNKKWQASATQLQQIRAEYASLADGAKVSLEAMGKAAEDSINSIWDGIDTTAAVTALEAQLQEVNRAYEGSEQARLDLIHRTENEISAARVTAVQSAMDQTLPILDQQHARRIALSEAELQTEIALIDRTAATHEEAARRTETVEGAAADRVREINRETLDKKKEYFEQAREALAKELDASLAREKSVAEEIKGIQKGIADARMSAEDKIRALKQKGMTDEQAYADKVEQVNEKIAKAAQLAATDTQASIAMYKEAQSMAASLAGEIKEGEKVVVSEQQSINTAISLVQQAQDGMEQAASAREGALKSALEQTKSNTTAIQQAIGTTDEGLSEIQEEIGDGISVTIDLKADAFETTMAKMTESRELLVTATGNFTDLSKELGRLNEQKLELMKEVEIRVNARFDDQLRELDALYGKVSQFEGKETTLKVAADDQASGKLDAVKEKTDGLKDHEFQVGADTAGAMQDLERVESKLKALDGKTYTSYHKVVSEMEASSAKPTTEKIAELESRFSQLGQLIETPRRATVSMTGDAGGGILPLTAAFDESVSRYNILKNTLERDKITGRVTIAGERQSFQAEVAAVKDTYQQMFASLSQGATQYGGTFNRVMRDVTTSNRGATSAIKGDTDEMARSLSDDFSSIGANAQTYAQVMRKALKEGNTEAYDAMTEGLQNYGDEFVSTMQANGQSAAKMAQEVIQHGESMISALSQRIEQIGQQIASIEESIMGIGESTAEKIRKLNQNLMTDYEKYLDDKKKAEELYAQAQEEMQAGNFERAKELMLESQNLAESLAREVRDANGEVIVSMEDATAIVIGMVQKAGDGATQALQQQKAALEDQQASARDEMAQTEALVDGLQEMTDSFNDSLTAALGKFTDSLTESMRLMTEDIKEAFAETKATAETPITPKIDISPAKMALAELAEESQRRAADMYKQMQSLGKEHNQYSQTLYKGIATEYQKALNLWKEYKSATSSKNMHDGGPVLASTGRYIRRRHGRLPGLDTGGDYVKVLARGGEWFIRNEAANHWGPNVMAAINAPWSGLGRRISEAISGMGGLSRRVGGAVGPMIGAPVLRFATGGPVSAGLDLANMGSLDLTAGGRKFPVIGKAEVLKMLKTAINDEKRMGVR